MYVKGEHVGHVPGISELVQEALSESAAGDEGYLVAKGLIPLPQNERARIRTEVMQALTAQAVK